MLVSGIDILDGTPVLDIKPYIPQYDCPSLWLSDKSADCEQDVGCDAEGYLEVTKEDVYKYDKNAESMMLKSKELIRESGTNIKELANTMEFANVNHRIGVKTNPDVDRNSATVNQNMSFGQIGKFNFYDDNGHLSAPVHEVEKLCQDSETSVEEDSSQRDREKTNVVECRTSGYSEIGSTNFENKPSDSAKCTDINRASNSLAPDKSLKADTGSSSHTADWISEPNVKQLYVRFTPSAEQQLNMFSETCQNDLHKLHFLKSTTQAREAIISILHEDPRSTYRRKKCVDNLYYFTVDILHVTCWFDEDIVEVVRIKPAALVEQCKSEYVLP